MWLAIIEIVIYALIKLLPLLIATKSIDDQGDPTTVNRKAGAKCAKLIYQVATEFDRIGLPATSSEVINAQ